MTKPNPGTTEAYKAGCTCPIELNNSGRGYYLIGVEMWVVMGDCPVHHAHCDLCGGLLPLGEQYPHQECAQRENALDDFVKRQLGSEGRLDVLHILAEHYIRSAEQGAARSELGNQQGSQAERTEAP